MKFLTYLAEYCGGLLIALLTIVTILIGGIIGLFELPKYLRKMATK